MIFYAILQPFGSSATVCNTAAAEKIFRLALDYDDDVASKISWKVNQFDITSETFVDFEDSGDSVQRTQRICVPPGTYEIIITDSSATGMGGGSYAGFLFGNELVFESDPNDVNWGEKRHIFCYGECASTSPSFSPSKSPSFSPSKRVSAWNYPFRLHQHHLSGSLTHSL